MVTVSCHSVDNHLPADLMDRRLYNVILHASRLSSDSFRGPLISKTTVSSQEQLPCHRGPLRKDADVKTVSWTRQITER